MSALQVNVAALLKECAGAAREYDVCATPQDLNGLVEDACPVAGLVGHLRLMRSPRSIFARGRLATRLAVECSRCLQETEVPIEFDLEAEFYPQLDLATGHTLPEPEDDLAFTLEPNHELDLREPVRQHVLLELPMRSLCAVTCRGLCAQCGANLNDGPCGCTPEALDERLLPLRALLDRDSGGSS